MCAGQHALPLPGRLVNLGRTCETHATQSPALASVCTHVGGPPPGGRARRTPCGGHDRVADTPGGAGTAGQPDHRCGRSTGPVSEVRRTWSYGQCRDRARRPRRRRERPDRDGRPAARADGRGRLRRTRAWPRPVRGQPVSGASPGDASWRGRLAGLLRRSARPRGPPHPRPAHRGPAPASVGQGHLHRHSWYVDPRRRPYPLGGNGDGEPEQHHQPAGRAADRGRRQRHRAARAPAAGRTRRPGRPR